ncbi:hypothetical protein Kfla_2326 [Kribbella flavida DSM 17836]|uniref:Uncharacterized protein n=1 Tax=Kribbella flavida (strain DSM 17836 / JCM 10339 / NBRC 14399) TaxID=479435 RepID=D2PUT6_KRIFD|nr:hypothetical protein [Kribbella flavida]ADB31402.1 hypothetical protein Kfla_2326 [Kribbella flavida DSM 17836]
MAKRRRKPARWWQFWRRAFWTRPGLVVLYALLVGALGLLILATVPGALADARGMTSAGECPRSAVRPEAAVAAPQGCLERVPVVLSGPHYSRGPGSEWWLEVGGRVYADVDLSTADSRRLADGDQAEALFWEGAPVLIEPEPGERVETESWGHSGWLLWLYVGLFALSGLPLLLQSAVLKRSTARGWWSVDGDEVGLIPGMTPLNAVGALLGAPAMLGFLPLAFGGSVLWSVVLAAAGLALAVFAAVKLLRQRSASLA